MVSWQCLISQTECCFIQGMICKFRITVQYHLISVPRDRADTHIYLAKRVILELARLIISLTWLSIVRYGIFTEQCNSLLTWASITDHFGDGLKKYVLYFFPLFSGLICLHLPTLGLRSISSFLKN